MFYGRNIWDPKLIIGQILTMQLLYYFCLGAFLWILDLLSGNTLSLDQIFNYQQTNFKTISGGMTVISFVLNSVCCGVFLVYVVERSRKCLDFAATVHIIHFIGCCVYMRGIPKSITWWFINIFSLALMVVLGEFLCMRRELQEIPLRGNETKTQTV